MTAFFWYFIIYSLIGFGLEVLFARVTHNPKRDRKCLYLLPLCPVYGLGGVLILLLPASLRGSPVALFFLSALLCTASEYLMGAFYERVALVSFWDYSHLPLNLGGKVCPLFSAFWGLLAMGLTYGIHPAVSRLVARIPAFLTLPAVLLFLSDSFFTLLLLRRTRTTESLRWYRRLSQPVPRHSKAAQAARTNDRLS